MPISFVEYEHLLESPSYSRFTNTNLHLHTPATAWDWDAFEGQTQESSSLTPESYFEHLNKTSLELVAITDHNTVCWCEPLISVSKQARKNKTSKIHVLPGVELNTWEGPHLCAIFDEDTDIKEIEKILTRLGFAGDGLKNESVTEDAKISNIISEVEKLQGLIIAPHVHNKNGVWGNKAFAGRYSILNHQLIRILAAPSGDIKRVIEPGGIVRLLCKSMDSDKITNSYGFIDIADCHRIDDFEVNTTWIKMTKPSLEGVRQLIFEPELRISHNLIDTGSEHENPFTIEFCAPTEISHPHILALTVTGGMLDGFKVQFSPHQNTIIGLNYAGKSALLDCIRFALNRVPINDALLSNFCKRIQAFVGIGGSVYLYCHNSDGSIIGVSRTCGLAYSKQGTLKEFIRFEGSSEIFSLFEGEFRHDTGVNIEDIFRPECYAQGEVSSIKNNIDQQMHIVNNLAGIASELQEVSVEYSDDTTTILGELTENSSSLVSYHQRIFELDEAITDIEPLKQEITELEELETSPLYSEMKEWADVGIKLDANIKNLSQVQKKWLEADLLSDSNEEEDSDASANQSDQNVSLFDEISSTPEQYLGHVSNILKTTISKLDTATKSNLTLLKESIDALNSLEQSRKERVILVDSKIRESITTGDLVTQGDALIGALSDKQKRLQQLEGKKSELESIKKKIAELEKNRKFLLKKFSDINERIRDRRTDIVTTIDSESLPNIKAELIHDSDKTAYFRLLMEIANELTDANNRIPNKEKQIGLVVATVNPGELVEMVRNGDPNRLCLKNPDITFNTSNILFKMNPKYIYKLETCSFDDSFIVSFKRKGDTEFTPIVEGLSGGEQSLALISVAMIPKQIPLIIDQPEDELGPALITNDLVEQIRNVKPNRQLIFVTHVPNIPVLADSEQIIYIKQNISESEKYSCVDCCGSLDNQDIVEHLLELDGGTIAFQKRSQRYSPFLDKSL